MKKQTLYLDMDGVVADWVAGAAAIVGYRLDDPKQFYPEHDWIKIRDHARMFRDLPKMPHADEMVRIARRFRDELDWELLFLTAIPHYNDVHWAFWDKMMWTTDYYPDIPVHFGPYSQDKEKHATPGDVLVDDRPDNCSQWRDKQGTAIEVKYGSYNSALMELNSLLERKLSLSRLGQL